MEDYLEDMEANRFDATPFIDGRGNPLTPVAIVEDEEDEELVRLDKEEPGCIFDAYAKSA